MELDQVYRLYFQDVELFLRGLTGSESLAEELTQEAFFRSLRQLDQLPQEQDVRAWLFAVARNCWYSYCRKAKHTLPLEPEAPLVSPQPDVEELLVDQEAAFTVHQCLHQLPEPYKEVFSLRVFGEMPFERIGALFGHNAAWARVTYYRAKTKLQQMLAPPPGAEK